MECLSVLLHLSLPMTTFLSLSHSLGRFKLPFCIEMSFLFSHFSHFWPFQYSPFETCPFPHSMLLHCCLSFTFHLVLPTYIPTHNYTSLSLSLSLSISVSVSLSLFLQVLLFSRTWRSTLWPSFLLPPKAARMYPSRFGGIRDARTKNRDQIFAKRKWMVDGTLRSFCTSTSGSSTSVWVNKRWTSVQMFGNISSLWNQSLLAQKKCDLGHYREWMCIFLA